jgi:hypothetical protein
VEAMNLTGSIAIFLCTLGALAYLVFGDKKWAWKLITVAIGTAIFLPILLNWINGKCFRIIGNQAGEGTAAMIICGVMAVAALLMLIFRRKFFSFLLVVLAVFLRLSFRIGQRVVEGILRFPPVLLPFLPERVIVFCASVLLIPATIVVFVKLIGGTLVLSDWPLGLPLISSLLFGFAGKYRYLKRERAGLSHV